LKLLAPTTRRWLDAVLADFGAFLVDHAACERKAMSTGMHFVVKYPDRTALLEPAIEFAKEELDHFHAVVRLVAKRGLRLAPDDDVPYVSRLLSGLRHGRDERFLDRLVVSAILEARGCERFGMLATALPEGEERALYQELTRADARHQRLFLEIAAMYFPQHVIESRLEPFLEREAEIIASLPPAPALYAGA
jgi:tRNA-(ms[2]io[6]A)-hydroxylase